MKAVERLDDHQTHLLHSPEHGEIRNEGIEESLGMEKSLGMEQSLGVPACRAAVLHRTRTAADAAGIEVWGQPFSVAGRRGDCVSESCFCSQGVHQGAPGPYGRRASTARKVPDGS